MIDSELLRVLMVQSPGVALALIVIWFYRNDFLRERARDAAAIERLLSVLERNIATQERLTVAAEKFERVADNLITYLTRYAQRGTESP